MAAGKKAHPEEETLELYVQGRLDEPELGELEEHLLVCADCQERLDEATDYTAVMREAVANVAAAPPELSLWRRWFGLDWLPMPGPAFAIAFAVVIAIFVWQPWRVSKPLEWRTVDLATMRGDAGAAMGLSGFPLDLRLEISGLDLTEATAQIVTADGSTVANMPLIVSGGRGEARYAPGLAAGRYWVRIKKSGETLREYSLKVESR